ncbi:MAG: hypothetical protein CDV28_1534 [Candidatus Electronema aureum]|uniref:Uncharacterized protein n=1 Tax=Candidatus Electronema aureum TaxID=2005002 RepID=A0A521FYM5_9BACT|nr:MAG: hypothetical protein CDV28_1534 [Candidatus Electronema aureum]
MPEKTDLEKVAELLNTMNKRSFYIKDLDRYLQVIFYILCICFSFSSKESIAGLFDKPFPICENIKSYMAFEMATSVKSRCDNTGVAMEIKELHYFLILN